MIQPNGLCVPCRKVRRMPRCWALAALLLAAPHQAQPAGEPMPGDYRIVNGRVDRGTYAGWRLFHTTCYGCHGVGGGGTDVAPNLLQHIKTTTPRAFAAKVLNSYRIVPPGDSANAEAAAAMRDAMLEDIMRRERGGSAQVDMPAWERDPRIDPHVLDLFAYLSARADGKLGPGKPARVASKKP